MDRILKVESPVFREVRVIDFPDNNVAEDLISARLVVLTLEGT